jgi:DNA-binding NarL/FixJ family response regulator
LHPADGSEGEQDADRSIKAMPSSEELTDAGLTGDELLLLPLLLEDMSFREIAERLHVPRSMIETQASAIYRKLGMSHSSDASERED